MYSTSVLYSSSVSTVLMRNMQYPSLIKFEGRKLIFHFLQPFIKFLSISSCPGGVKWGKSSGGGRTRSRKHSLFVIWTISIEFFLDFFCFLSQSKIYPRILCISNKLTAPIIYQKKVNVEEESPSIVAIIVAPHNTICIVVAQCHLKRTNCQTDWDFGERHSGFHCACAETTIHLPTATDDEESSPFIIFGPVTRILMLLIWITRCFVRCLWPERNPHQFICSLTTVGNQSHSSVSSAWPL